jgi:hypothetical protein
VPGLPAVAAERNKSAGPVGNRAGHLSPLCAAILRRHVESLYQVQNTAGRYDDWLLNPFDFNNEESFFLYSVVRRVDHFASEDVTTVQIHQYFLRVRDVDVKNSEAYPLILQLHIARF